MNKAFSSTRLWLAGRFWIFATIQFTVNPRGGCDAVKIPADQQFVQTFGPAAQLQPATTSVPFLLRSDAGFELYLVSMPECAELMPQNWLFALASHWVFLPRHVAVITQSNQPNATPSS